MVHEILKCNIRKYESRGYIDAIYGQVDRTTLSLNNKCSGRRQKRRIIEREAWTATTLKFKGGIHESFQESFSAHNSTLLLDKISDRGPPAVASCIFTMPQNFSRSGTWYREWLKYSEQSTSYSCFKYWYQADERGALSDGVHYNDGVHCRDNWFHSRSRD